MTNLDDNVTNKTLHRTAWFLDLGLDRTRNRDIITFLSDESEDGFLAIDGTTHAEDLQTVRESQNEEAVKVSDGEVRSAYERIGTVWNF